MTLDAPIQNTECTIVRGFIDRGLFRRLNLWTAPEGFGVDTRDSAIAIFLALTCGIGLAGCGALPPQDSSANEVRTIRPNSDTSKTVTVPEGMVWYSTASRSSGLRFPPGTYALEAEDDDYWYFRAPSPLEFRSFVNGKPSEEYTKSGGLMLGKRAIRLVPGAGYVDADGLAKIMVWKLGGNFLALEGRQWRKSF